MALASARVAAGSPVKRTGAGVSVKVAAGLAVIRRAAILRLPRAGGLLLLAAQNLSHLLYSL